MVEKLVIAAVIIAAILAFFAFVPLPDLAGTASQAFDLLRNTGGNAYVDRNPMALAGRIGEVIGLGHDMAAIKIAFAAIACFGMLLGVFFLTKVWRG